MTILILFVSIVFTVACIYMMLAPFLGGARGRVRAEYLDEEVREIEQLVARRQVLVSSLRELEFEHETNRIAPEDYEAFRKRYEREAVAILRRLDELHGGRGWEERIEGALTERLGRTPRFAKRRDDDDNVTEESTP